MASDDGRPLFSGLVVSAPQGRRHLPTLRYSLAIHGLVVVVVLLVVIFGPTGAPEPRHGINVLLYNPPPPPPPPLASGSELIKQSKPVRPATPEIKPDKDRLTPPSEQPTEEKPKPETKPPEQEQPGAAKGTENGSPDGMEIGVDGGQVGGVPNGQLGGVVGGTGDTVMDYDLPPRLIYQTRPVYPPDAFVKKIEGTVEVEFVIGVDGRVKRVSVIKGIPALNAAAVQTVMQWVFSPALKGGHPVSTIARAPVRFSIY